jgi:uncharacterized protein (DUF2237 family)
MEAGDAPLRPAPSPGSAWIGGLWSVRAKRASGARCATFPCWDGKSCVVEPRPMRTCERGTREALIALTRRSSDTASMPDRNVLGGELEPCGIDPLTGFYRDGCCRTGPEDRGSHTICAVVTAAFLEHQRRIGNDLVTPVPQYRFPGLEAGDRWCVTAMNWLRAHADGAAAYVVLASTHERALEFVPLAALREHAVDVPSDPGPLTE